MDQLLDVTEARRALGISRPTLYRLIRSREIAVVKIGARTLFRADDLHHFIDQHVRPAAGIRQEADPTASQAVA
jgi:excisionase family DNA binding protein